MAPSPDGKGWGKENKIKALSTSPHPTFSLWRRLFHLADSSPPYKELSRLKLRAHKP